MAWQESALIQRYGVRVRVLGELSLLPESVHHVAHRIMAATASHTACTLNICFSYTYACACLPSHPPPPPHSCPLVPHLLLCHLTRAFLLSCCCACCCLAGITLQRLSINSSSDAGCLSKSGRCSSLAFHMRIFSHRCIADSWMCTCFTLQCARLAHPLTQQR